MFNCLLTFRSIYGSLPPIFQCFILFLNFNFGQIYRLMKKLLLSVFFIVFAISFSSIHAQTEKTIIIKKKIVDSDGNETVEEIILTGEDAENADLDAIINENIDGNEIDIDVDVEEIIGGSGTNMKTDGNHVKILKFKSDGDEDIQIIRDGQIEKKIIIKGDNINQEDLDVIINESIEDGQVRIKVDVQQMDDENIKIIKDGQVKKKIIIMSDGEETMEEIIIEDLDEILDNGDFEWNDDNNHSFQFKMLDEENGDPKAFLGVWPGEDSNENGVVLGGIVESSAAEKAGLQEGDIITTIGGKPARTFSELAAIIKDYQPNENVVIQYIRNGENRSANVTLGEKKAENNVFFEDVDIEIDTENLDMENWSKEDYFMRGMKMGCCEAKEVEKAYIGIMIENDDKGIRIVDVNRDDNILSENDIITKFGREDVENINELIQSVEGYEPGDKVKVKYIRDGKVKKSKVKLLGRTVKECCNNSCCTPKEKKKKKTEIIIKKRIEKEIKSDAGNSLLELEEVNLFPNPTDGSFKLEFTSEDISPVSITINDSNGKEIIKDEIKDFNGNYSGDFNLKGNAPGLYLVNISQNGKVLTQKIIVK